MPGVGFPRSPQDTRKTQDTPIPAVLGKTLTDYEREYRVSGIGVVKLFYDSAKPQRGDGI